MRYTIDKCKENEGIRGDSLWGIRKAIPGKVPLQRVQLLEKSQQNPSQICRDHHVTRSLLYYWWQLYQQQGEATFAPTQEVLSPRSAWSGHTPLKIRWLIWNDSVENKPWNWSCSKRR